MATAIKVPMASRVCRERMVPEIPRLPIGRTPMRTGTKHTLLATSTTGSSRATTAFRLSSIEMRDHRTGAIYFLLIGEKQRRRAHFEGVNNLHGNPVEQVNDIAGFEQALAERVELFNFAAARGGVRELVGGRAWKDGWR